MPGLAGDSSGQGKGASPEDLGGCHRLAQSGALGPAGQIVGHDLYRQPGSIGREAPRGEMIEPNAVLETPDGILYLGVAAVVGLQFQGLAVSVGDEGVIAVFGEQRQLRAGGGPHPAYDEPLRRVIGLTGKGNVFGLGHVGPAVHPVRDGPPVRLGYGRYQVPPYIDWDALFQQAGQVGVRARWTTRKERKEISKNYY